MKAHNKVGVQFSQAMRFVMSSVGIVSAGDFEVQAVSLTLPLEKQFMAARRASFQDHCIDNVIEKASDPDYLVLMVENAYFADNAESGLMVAFNPKPVTFAHCQTGNTAEGCNLEQTVVDYFNARWMTRMKYVLDLISIT